MEKNFSPRNRPVQGCSRRIGTNGDERLARIISTLLEEGGTTLWWW
jgi:hypothetical protein